MSYVVLLCTVVAVWLRVSTRNTDGKARGCVRLGDNRLKRHGNACCIEMRTRGGRKKGPRICWSWRQGVYLRRRRRQKMPPHLPLLSWWCLWLVACCPCLSSSPPPPPTDESPSETFSSSAVSPSRLLLCYDNHGFSG